MYNTLGDPVQVTITSPTLKKGKHDVRTFNAFLNAVGDERTYVLTETKREMDRKRFDLIPGAIITDLTGTYTCRQVTYLSNVHRIVPVILAS